MTKAELRREFRELERQYDEEEIQQTAYACGLDALLRRYLNLPFEAALTGHGGER